MQGVVCLCELIVCVRPLQCPWLSPCGASYHVCIVQFPATGCSLYLLYRQFLLCMVIWVDSLLVHMLITICCCDVYS